MKNIYDAFGYAEDRNGSPLDLMHLDTFFNEFVCEPDNAQRRTKVWSFQSSPVVTLFSALTKLRGSIKNFGFLEARPVAEAFKHLQTIGHLFRRSRHRRDME
ncbi:MAG: hypothetical protein J2P54_12785 [Bradyrhizobiaceae bacterium]|nr:hypothetical protein [Bradyrhizobiaceae bacterium]